MPPRHSQINVYHPHKDHRNAPPIRKFTDGENDLHHNNLIGWSRAMVTFLLTGTPCALISVSFLGTASSRSTPLAFIPYWFLRRSLSLCTAHLGYLLNPVPLGLGVR